MATYRITGIWKSDNVISHYAIHSVSLEGTSRLVRKTKAQVIKLVEDGNTVTTWVWNYKTCAWNVGENVHVVGTGANRYLRSNPDNRITDNLAHLLNMDWFIPA